ncbi:MAG: acetyl-CoA carboxylase carboxyltransferase subunit alpha [Planctomycetota bacterium]
MATDETPREPAGLPFERDIQEMERKLADLETQAGGNLDISDEVEALRAKLRELLVETYAGLSAWDQVTVARHPDRPVAGDYISGSLDEFFELHGDKTFGDDPAIVTGLARIGDRRFMLVGHRKGRTTKERLRCNFGCAHPEGYRKALRKMELAERLGLPIVTLINTPGAYPGIGAEERGQAAAIAENILKMFDLRVPIVSYVIGEGGSGGALGIGVADRVLMQEYAYYSVISPEGCAAILWKDGARSPEAAEALGLTASTLSELGIIDGVVEEPLGGAHRDREAMIAAMRTSIEEQLASLEGIDGDTLVASRREKFRRLGAIEDRFPVLG